MATRHQPPMRAGALRREAQRKLIQAAGFTCAPCGRVGAVALLACIVLDVAHLTLPQGLPAWRRIRRFGERGERRDIGPILLAAGAAIVLSVVRGPGAWAILAQPFLADSAAALTGMMVGGPRWPRTHRTLAGSLVFFAVAAAVPLALGMDAVSAATLAAAGTVVEGFSPRGLDNLLVPIAVLGVWHALN